KVDQFRGMALAVGQPVKGKGPSPTSDPLAVQLSPARPAFGRLAATRSRSSLGRLPTTSQPRSRPAGRTSQRMPAAALSTGAAGAPPTPITSTLGAPCSSFQPMSTGSSADIGLGAQVTDQPDGPTAATPSPVGTSWAPSGSQGSGLRTPAWRSIP